MQLELESDFFKWKAARFLNLLDMGSINTQSALVSLSIKASFSHFFHPISRAICRHSAD